MPKVSVETAMSTSSEVPIPQAAEAASSTESVELRALTIALPAIPRTASAPTPATRKPKPTARSVSRRRPRAR